MNQPFPGPRVVHSTDAVDDAALVRAGLAGERRALDELVGRYQRPVFNAALRILGHRDDAREVTQTVFLKACQKLDHYDPGQRFFSWIYRIAVNESLDCLAARRRHEPVRDDMVLDRPQPDAECERDQLERGLQTALLALTPEQRTVIVLKHLLGCSYENLCTILDVPLTTVKSRLFAARSALRDVCAKQGLL